MPQAASDGHRTSTSRLFEAPATVAVMVYVPVSVNRFCAPVREPHGRPDFRT